MKRKLQKLVNKYLELKGLQNEGKLSAEDFRSQVQNLAVQDEEKKGCWWNINPEDDCWIHYDGEQWIEQAPAGFNLNVMQPAEAAMKATEVVEPEVPKGKSAPAKAETLIRPGVRKRRRGRAWLWAVVAVVAVAVIAGGGIGLWMLFQQKGYSGGGGGGGGGGATMPEVLTHIHKGKLYSAGAWRPVEMNNSEFYKQFKREVKNIENQVRGVEEEVGKMNMKLDQIGSITLMGTMNHYEGRFEADLLQEYYETKENRDIDEQIMSDRTYYLDKKSDGGFAYMLVAGGLLRGTQEDIENTINAMTQGKDKLNDDKGFQTALGLADFGATQYFFQWDDLKNIRDYLKRQMEQIENDKNFLDAFDGIDAACMSQFWRGDFEQVLKIHFSEDKSAEEVDKVLNDNKKKITETIPDLFMPSFFFYAKDRSKIKDLWEKVTISRQGAVLEIRVRFNWDDVADIFAPGDRDSDFEGPTEEPAEEEPPPGDRE